MVLNVLKYLENSAALFPDKAGVIDGKKTITYAEMMENCSAVGTAIYSLVGSKKPVGVYMEKSADALCAMLGAVYGGCFYSSLNVELPEGRLRQIAKVLCPALIITSAALEEEAKTIFTGFQIETYEKLVTVSVQPSLLRKIEKNTIDTDPLYINFTSGSTGTPKGIVVSHRSVIDFIECFCETFGFCGDDVFANQAPFDFDVSVKDIFSSLKCCATLLVVPRKLFSAPAQLVDFLNDNKVTVMVWAVSALCLLSTFHALDYKTPESIRKILFSGEVMPLKALKNFRQHLPDATFVNLYGPTEITCNCTYHVLSPLSDYENGIPIGKPFLNEDVFLLSDCNEKITSPDTVGEICVRGSALALGYYCCEEQNNSHFVQNPLNSFYPERIYRTGDLGKYDSDGELFFCGRKDFQIKYMGHRIELEEIERAMGAIDGVESCCCVFDEKKSRLRGFYVGSISGDELYAVMKEKLPSFMVPGVLKKLDCLPLTKNGKIDRNSLRESVGVRSK